MKNRKSFLVCCIVLILVLATSFILGCKPADTTPTTPVGPTTPGEVKTLEIGALFSVTGMFSVREIPDYNEAEICADIINENGGITVNGQKYNVELVLEDCKTTMDGVTAAANRLVYDKGIKFTLGPTAFFAAAAGPVCDPNEVLRVITWSVHTPGELDSTTPYAFLASNASILHGTAGVLYLKENYPDVKKVALVTVDDGAVPYIVPLITKVLNNNGIEVVGDVISYPNEMQDFSPIVAKLNSNTEADAIFMQNGLGPQFGAIVKGLRELGNTKPYVGSNPTLMSEVIAIAGADACVDVFSTAYSPDEPKLTPTCKEIIKRAQAKYGADYPLLLTGANCLWVLAEVIEGAQSLDPKVVKEYWESLETVDTLFGPACVCGDETFGIANHVVASPQGIQIIKDGVPTSGGLIDVGCIP
jgi:branched-chain amino acid transport system substrate-binding protein